MNMHNFTGLAVLDEHLQTMGNCIGRHDAHTQELQMPLNENQRPNTLLAPTTSRYRPPTQLLRNQSAQTSPQNML